MITWERVPTLFSIIASDRVALCCFPSPEPLILKNMGYMSLALFYFHIKDRMLLPALPPRVFPFFQHNKVLASLSMSVKRKQQESFLMTCASSVFSALGASTSWFQACRPWHLSPRLLWESQSQGARCWWQLKCRHPGGLHEGTVDRCVAIGEGTSQGVGQGLRASPISSAHLLRSPGEIVTCPRSSSRKCIHWGN